MDTTRGKWGIRSFLYLVVTASLAVLTASVGEAVGAPVARLILHSEPGDYIGGGQDFDVTYTPADVFFQATVYRTVGPPPGAPALLFFVVGSPATSESDDYIATLWFGTDQLGVPIVPGTYPNAQRAPFAAPGHSGLDIGFQHRGCNTLVGSFVVTDATFAVDAQGVATIRTFAATFEQHCESFAAALRGSFFYDSGVPPPSTPLVYRSVAPCRILDTRVATVASGVQGPIIGNSLKTLPGFIASGSNWGQYGGNATSDCGLTDPPGTSIRAVALLATILNPNFDAYLGIGDTPSLSSVLSNVALNFTSGQGLSTLYLVPQITSNNIYFAMPAGLSAHVIFDVVGYHVQSDATALQCTTASSAATTIGASASGTAISPACTAGYALTSGSCDSDSSSISLVASKASGQTWACSATNTGGSSAHLTATGNCCRIGGK